MQLQARQRFFNDTTKNYTPSQPEYDWEYLRDEETMAKCYVWETLANALSGGESSDSEVLAVISAVFSSSYILHEAISLGVPEHTLVRLADRFPDFLADVDDNGWYPIHVACAEGASAEFASYCIDRNPPSVDAKDIEGETPAHLLCQGSWQGFWDKFNPAAEKNMMEILWMLYLKSPSSVVSEDYHGVGCIEHAITCDLGSEFIRDLKYC